LFTNLIGIVFSVCLLFARQSGCCMFVYAFQISLLLLFSSFSYYLASYVGLVSCLCFSLPAESSDVCWVTFLSLFLAHYIVTNCLGPVVQSSISAKTDLTLKKTYTWIRTNRALNNWVQTHLTGCIVSLWAIMLSAVSDPFWLLSRTGYVT